MQPRRRAFVLAGTGTLLLRAAAASAAEPWAELRRGGHVILMRHAATEPGLGDPATFRLGDCSTQRNLSEQGRADSKRAGERVRAERVRIARVYTSPWCRCRDTATLAFGSAEDWDPLSSFFDLPHREGELTETVRKRIASYSFRKPAGNVVMVTHNVNIAALTKLSVAPAEMVVVRPDGCCGLKVVGSIRA